MKNFQLKFFSQNIDCGYTLEPPRRCGSNEYPQSIFGAKIRKICIPLQTPVLLYKSGVQGGILLRICYHDVIPYRQNMFQGRTGQRKKLSPEYAKELSKEDSLKRVYYHLTNILRLYSRSHLLK